MRIPTKVFEKFSSRVSNAVEMIDEYTDDKMDAPIRCTKPHHENTLKK